MIILDLKSHYSLALKRIIVLAYTKSVTTKHIREKRLRVLCLLLQNGSLRRPLFHPANYPPPGRWALSISRITNQIA